MTRARPTCCGCRDRTGERRLRHHANRSAPSRRRDRRGGSHERPSAMVMPIYDDNPFTQPIKPVVTWCLIALNLLVFLYEAGATQLALERIIDIFSLTPAALIGDMPA